jgi:ferredoxin
LGGYDLQLIEITGELKRIDNYKLSPLRSEANMNNLSIQAAIHSRSVLRPHVDPESCTGCRICADQCPVNALFIDECIPLADAGLRIVCF